MLTGGRPGVRRENTDVAVKVKKQAGVPARLPRQAYERELYRL
jgi:hypothetical protein